MAKKPTASKLKKKLDTIFSQYIRLREADSNGNINCFTCGVNKHYKEMHAGHFQSRRHLSTRWDEINVQNQCPKCNLFSQGEQFKFGLYLDSLYGEGTAEHLQIKAQQLNKMTVQDYQDLIDYYGQKVKELVEQ